MIALSSNRPQTRKDPHLIVRALGRSLTAAVLLLCLPTLALASAESELAIHRGVAAFGEGDREDARQRFEEVIREDPDNASALHYLGLIAIQNRDTQSAIDYLQRVVAVTPDSETARIDLGAQLLKARRDEEALTQFNAVLERDADHGLALLYKGIALYRVRAYSDALDSLERAVELDGELSAEAHYYIGLSEAYLGDSKAAAAAFSTAASASPQHPLGRSASSLSKQAARAGRRWSLAATVGFEYNDNVRLSPDHPPWYPPQPGSADSGAGVARLQGQIEAYGGKSLSWRFGYDGYLQIYTNTNKDDYGTAEAEFSAYDLSQQTHVAWTNATYELESVSLALRYDFSYTAIDLTDHFRYIHRVAPTIYVPISNWGLFLGYYQFLFYDYKIWTDPQSAFDRSGPQHSVGAQQFVFLPEPFKYTVIGALLTNFDSDGTEFRHNGVEVSAGGEMELPWRLSASLLYRYAYRNYTKYSELDPSTKREDNQHEISFNFDRTFARRYNVSLAGSYSHNSSNIENFDISRFIIGTYFGYAF
jgi:tetratricopeptide (TPR) repeat protein